MSNSYSLSPAADFAALSAEHLAIMTVVDAIQNVDVPALQGEHTAGFAATAGVIVVEEYTTGAGDWTCPADVHEIEVMVVAGGGSGGSVAAESKGGGGGGGGAVGVYRLGVNPGAVIPYTVGAGGTQPATGDIDGNDGSDSIFGEITVAGGIKGLKATTYTGGNGADIGALTGGAGGGISTIGGTSEWTTAYIGEMSGAGGGGGATISGANGGRSVYAIGGESYGRSGGGGASFGDGGDGGPGNDENGVAGAVNTGGGGGGASGFSVAKYGGAGGSGYIKITYRK